MEMKESRNQKANTDHVAITMDEGKQELKTTVQEENKKSIQPQAPNRTKTLRRLNFSRPRSRFTELNYPVHEETIFETSKQQQPPLNLGRSEESSSSSTDEEEEEEEDWYENEGDGERKGNRKKYKKRKPRKRKMNRRALIEWTLFLIIMTCLICSLTLNSLKKEIKWGLKIWKWCLMVMVLFCGRLVSGWVVSFLVFLIERNFMLREKVLYFVYGLRRSFQSCVWLGLVLISWMIMFPNVHKHNPVLKKVFRALVAVLIGATIWLLKILFVKVLASSFHVATFFDRMQESVFHHYVLDALSGPPLDKEQRETPRGGRTMLATKRFGSRRTIDREKLKKLSMRSTTSAWSVKRLVSYVMYSGLSTISTAVDDFGKGEESEITSEKEARNCAQRIFKNVAKHGAKYIDEEDLLRFLTSEEVYTIWPLFDGAVETGRITKSSFRNWVVHAYVERKALAHSLNDTKTAVHQLHKLASTVVIAIIVVISLLVMGLATTKVIFVVTSQLLLVGFMFQNTCKTMFESIIFVFVMHPFDVGDRCCIDGVHMIVEEMNILSTVFLRYDSEKIYYPNSVLITKPISNFRRSPDMADSVNFTIDVSTPIETINALKKAILTYIESRPKYWSPKHSVTVKEIENMDKMKMSLCVQHTMNHQNFGERNARRSELILELKKTFELLDIKYHLLPQEVHLMSSNGRIPFQS